jgi:enamine deaminase RidA (YjgF/YER057c/UK114 family)
MIERIDIGRRMSEAVITPSGQGLIFLAGQVAETHAGASVVTQSREVLERIDAVLARAGSDKTKIASATIYLADISDFSDFNSVWDAWVPQGHTPARACVQAKLAGSDFKVEISIVAVR